MKLHFLSGILLSFISFSMVKASNAQPLSNSNPPPGASFEQGEILVKIDGSVAPQAAKARSGLGAQVVRTSASGWQKISLPAGVTVAEALKRYKDQGISEVQPNFRYKTYAVPNDANYSQQWALSKIEAPRAWNATLGSRTIVVATLDSGIQTTHPDLVKNLWVNPKEIPNNGIDDDANGYVDDVNGWNTINNSGVISDDDAAGHGTHVAGIIGAVGNNAVGICGVNWMVRVLPMKMIDASGGGDSDDAITCIDYLIKLKKTGVNIRVINCSWGSEGGGEAANDLALKQSIELAGKNNILVVCAAGNGGSDQMGDNLESLPSYPASYPSTNIVSVSASDQNDNIASFSNFGKISADLAAPGVGILSTINTGGYEEKDGTSMAAPFVAGAAALLLAKDKSLSTLALKDRLLASVDQLPQWAGKVSSGGRLNLAKLLAGQLYKINGTVTRDVGGGKKSPMAGVLLYLDGALTYATSTRSDGTYSLTGLLPGTHKVQAKLTGFNLGAVKSTTLPTTGKAYSPNETLDFSAIATSKVYTLSGIVYTQNASGGSVPVQNAEIYQSPLTTPIATSDAAGKYEIKNFATGSYTLSAQKPGYGFKAQPSATVTFPTSGSNVSPNASINFLGGLTDGVAPEITITMPVDGATYSTANLKNATGTASDPLGVSNVYFSLVFFDESFDFYAWNWTTKQWTTNLDDPNTILDKSFAATNVNWSIALPTLNPGQYVLDVRASDIGGTETGQMEDTTSSFQVDSAALVLKDSSSDKLQSGPSDRKF